MRIRFDLFICMVIAGALFAAVWFVGDKLQLNKGVYDVISNIVDVSEEVSDGEVGGYPTQDTPIVSNMQEVAMMAQAGKSFSIEISTARLAKYGVLNGKEYDWRILELADGGYIAAKVNSKKIQDSEMVGNYILPVGKVVMEEPEVLDEMIELLTGSTGIYVPDAYIDMDGEAKTSYISPGMETAMIIMTIISMVKPYILFALYIIAVLWIHSLFAKKGIFPPIFPK